MMKRETLLTISLIALLLLNIGTLGFLFLRKGPAPGEHRPLDRLILKTLDFDPSQQASFESLKTAHHEKMLRSDGEYRRVLETYFDLLKNEKIVPAQLDSLEAELSKIQVDRARTTFRHFEELKALCTPEQKQKFDTLIPDLMQVVLPPRRDAARSR